MVIARRAPDMLGTLLASGIACWIAIEALINMAAMVGLVPFAGNALPFISAGGSNLVSVLCAGGIMLNISRQSGENVKQEENDWRSFGAVVNLRGRDGRRSVPRARRSRRAKG
jgi:cell division protein FtsW